MGALDYALLALIHPVEFRSLIQYYLWHDSNRDITQQKSSGWDRETMRECWAYLPKTSRSFAAVIKQLDGDLARTVSLSVALLQSNETVALTRHTRPFSRRDPHQCHRSAYSTSFYAAWTPSRTT